MKIEITMEKSYRISKEFEATEEQIEMLSCGINPFQAELEAEIEDGTEEIDYAVCDENGETIVDWE